VQITARAEAGHEQVCIRFEVSPPDAAVSKYMVLCTTASGKAIKSKKVQCFKRNGTRDQGSVRKAGRYTHSFKQKSMEAERREA
jgi:hypothetical protein